MKYYHLILLTISLVFTGCSHVQPDMTNESTVQNSRDAYKATAKRKSIENQSVVSYGMVKPSKQTNESTVLKKIESKSPTEKIELAKSDIQSGKVEVPKVLEHKVSDSSLMEGESERRKDQNITSQYGADNVSDHGERLQQKLEPELELASGTASTPVADKTSARSTVVEAKTEVASRTDSPKRLTVEQYLGDDSVGKVQRVTLRDQEKQKTEKGTEVQPVVKSTPNPEQSPLPAEDRAAELTRLDSEGRSEPSEAVGASTDQTLLSLEQLPLMIDQHWSLDLLNLRGEPTACYLTSQVSYFEDGQGGTPLQIAINRQKLMLKTKSNIDLSYSGDGISIDDHPLFELDYVKNEVSAVLEKEIEQVLAQLRSARQLEVHLGFWPTWPQTQTYSATVDVTQLKRAQSLLAQCNAMLVE